MLHLLLKKACCCYPIQKIDTYFCILHILLVAGGAVPVKGERAMKRVCKSSAVCVTFGLGLLAATVLPAKCVLVLVALALVLVGCSCVKY